MMRAVENCSPQAGSCAWGGGFEAEGVNHFESGISNSERNLELSRGETFELRSKRSIANTPTTVSIFLANGPTIRTLESLPSVSPAATRSGTRTIGPRRLAESNLLEAVTDIALDSRTKNLCDLTEPRFNSPQNYDQRAGYLGF